jgi:hypothetical protein
VIFSYIMTNFTRFRSLLLLHGYWGRIVVPHTRMKKKSGFWVGNLVVSGKIDAFSDC